MQQLKVKYFPSYVKIIFNVKQALEQQTSNK